MIRVMWITSGVMTSVVAILAEGSPVTLQAIVFLCGILSVLFSLTFGALLKHLASHSEYKDQIEKLTQALVKESSCEKNRNQCMAGLNLRMASVESLLRQLIGPEPKEPENKG